MRSPLIEERWVSIALGGVSMEKISLPFFYQLGAQLNPLTKMEAKASTRMNIWIETFNVKTNVRTLLDSPFTLVVCRVAGEELISAIEKADEWIRKTESKEWEKENYSADSMFRQLIEKANKFQTVLSEELQTLETYHAAQKGNYSTTGLIKQAENILPESIRNKMNFNIVEEIQHSGRCLVFDNSTASGFHILRATELVMHEYYLAVCKPKPEPAGRLESWGAYLAELKKSTDPDVQKVVTLLQQIKDDDRNLIMHPERVLSPDDAFILFETAKSAIIAMGINLPEGKKK